MANIKVALRVRPLTAREATFDQRLAVHVDANNTVNLHNSSKTGIDNGWDRTNNASNRTRQFAFDYCFWSADGSCPAANIASQENVFEELGTQVLDALFDGYNACVLAYGQSGTGKTYTMMGTPSEPGLAPRLCRAIFERMISSIEDDCNNGHRPSFRIDVSFMEIYNEKVRDLLEEHSPSSSQNGGQLKIREHPKSGPYVQGLSRHAVSDATTALKLLSDGLQRRSSAATHSNVHSSRSHAVFTVHCTAAWIVGDGLPRETVAKLHLVDLAGSERANHDLISRLRLKEGSLINKSLATLGNVINALAERSASSLGSISSTTLNSSSSSTCSSNATSIQTTPSGSPRRSRTPFIPYRDSVLTWILKDSLGGNSRTFVVAAISPSIRAYKETLNTLRFAQRAKFIVNQPVINEEASVKLIRHLKEEVSRLRALLGQSVEYSQTNKNPTAIRSEAITELMSVNQSKARELTEDWLHKWRSLESEEDKVITHTPSRSSDIGVQTSFPILIDDPADLIPVKEEKGTDNWRLEEEQISEREADVWSDDSLDGNSYPNEIGPEKINQSFTESFGMSKPSITQELTFVKTGAPTEECFTPLWPESYQQRRSPLPTSHRRINARKLLKSRPDVRTIFSYQEDDQQQKCPSRLPTPTIVFDPPSASVNKESFADPRDKPSYSGGRILYTHSSSQSYDELQSKLEGEALLARLNSLIDKMAISGTQVSHRKKIWPLHRNIQPERKPEMVINAMNCCCVNHHQCAHYHNINQDCPVQHQQFYQPNRRCQIHQPAVISNISFEAIIREELLAIRRRMVARTASPKVLTALPYLKQWQTYSSSSHHAHDKNCHCQQNLPGEIWV